MLLQAIRNGNLIPKGTFLNGKIPMDAENYCVQAGDMLPFKSLVEELSVKHRVFGNSDAKI
ncbi:MAG: hypothetical protein NC127_08790 [Muribaculum sp.]|nr:hypothetical protein [Muribaculum sp.]